MGQRTEPDTPPNVELPLLVVRVAKAMVEEHRARRPESQQSSPFKPIRALATRYVEAREGATTVDLAQYLGITKQSASEIVCALERGGYITRSPHPDDGRARTIELTAEGRRALAVSHRRWVDIDRSWEEVAGADDLQAVRRALERFFTRDSGR